MIRAKTKFILLAAGAFISAASAALAERAVVVANFAYPDAPAQQELRDRALKVSETLLGLGYQVTRLENPDQTRFDDALSAVSDVDGPVVIYYAGRTTAQGEQSLLLGTASGDTISLQAVLTAVDTSRRDLTSVFLDVCSSAAPPVVIETVGPPAEDEAPVMPPAALAPLPTTDGVLIASSVPAGVACSPADVTLTETLIERLEVPALDIGLMFDGADVAIQSTVSVPFVFRPATSGMRLTAADYKMFDGLTPEKQTQMLELWANAGIAVDRAGALPARTAPTATVPRETVVLTEPVRPVSGGVTLVPVRSNVTTVTGGVRLAAPTTPVPQPVSANISRPVPGAGGLPQPSIIVGLLEEVTEASFATAEEPVAPVSGSIIAFDDIDGRQALRDNDPELFASLLETGAFDPPPAELARALQTELARMNCYTSGIDGQWGPGSRASVGRYYEQIGGAAPSQDADVRIFRQIALRDDVTCPAVQARPAAQPRTPRPATTTPQAATPTPAPSTGTPPRVINRDRGVGVGTGVGR